jgi:fructokinase
MQNQLERAIGAQRFIALGEVLWDLFPDSERFGGAPANFACHAALRGASVSMFSAVGEDDRGRRAREILEGYSIDCSEVLTVRGIPTGTVGVKVDSAGKPTFTIHENAAWDSWVLSASALERIPRVDAVYFGTLGQRSATARTAIREAVATARKAGVPRLLDVNLRRPFFDDRLIRESIEMASFLKLSDDELPFVASACGIAPNLSGEQSLEILLEMFGLETIVMTCGADGATLVTRSGIVREPAAETTVVDTVGAGDSFAAAFLWGSLRGDSPARILRQATEAAAATCAHAGAVPLRNSSR